MANFKDQRIPRFGFTSADPTSDIPADALITGSKNLMYRGQSELEAVGGFEPTTYGSQAQNFGGDISMLVGKGYAVIGNNLGVGSGNIIEFVGRSLWYTGVGDITVFNPGITAAPVALGNSPLQNNIPQVSVVNDTKTGYSAPFQIGLLKQITAPQLSVAPTGVQNKLNGTYSVVLTWLRDATGAESLPSPPSNIVQFSNQTGILQFPVSTNPVNPRDRWRVYGTPSGFGAIGGYFFFIEVPERRVNTQPSSGYAVELGTGFNVFRKNPVISGLFSSEQIGKRLVFFNNVAVQIHSAVVTGVVNNTFVVKGITYGDAITFSPPFSGALSNLSDFWQLDSFIGPIERALTVEWFDNELGAEQPPVDAFPPASTAQFVGAIGNVMILVGTEDGSGIACSVPNFPESFPPDFRMNLSEPPVGVLSRPQDGFLYVLGENSITELLRTSTDVSPIMPRVVADQVGAASQRAACMAGNSIYLFTKSKTAARILPDGSVDVSFGNRVEALTETWTANQVSLSFDERKGFVAYCHGTTMLLYYPAFDYWAPPVSILDIAENGRPDGDGVVRSAFTRGGVIHTSFFESRVIAEVDGNGGITVTGGPLDFSELDIGRFITINGAGVAGGVYTGTITNVSLPANLTVSPPMSTVVNNVPATISGFRLYTFDRDQNNVDLEYDSNWTARFAFGDFGLGLMPKTITKAIVGMKGEVTSRTLRFWRNYNLDLQMGADRTFSGGLGNRINNIVDCNNGEGQLISVELSGNESRSKIYFIEVQGFASGVETNYGV